MYAIRLLLLFCAVAISPVAGAQTSNISGTVRTHGNLGPLPGAQVEIRRVESFAGYVIVASGTSGADGSFDLAYVGGCAIRCEIRVTASGRVVVPQFRQVTQPPGASISGQDFTASIPASINVRLVDSATSATLGTPQPRLFDSNDQMTALTPTLQPDGSWQFAQVAPYALRVCAIDHRDETINECQNGQQLPLSSSVAGASAILPAEGESLNLQLVLDPGASVTGEIRDRFYNTALPGRSFTMEVSTISGSAAFSTGLTTNSAARYRLSGLPSGPLRLTVSTFNPYYTGMRYPGIDCIDVSNCSGTAGSYITVQGAATVDNVGFDLFPGSVVRGRVTNQATGNGIGGVDVVHYQPPPILTIEKGRTTTAADGFFELAHVRPLSNVRLGTQNVLGYANRAWPDVPCLGDCSIGSNLVFPAGEVPGQTNFVLPAARAIAGSFVVNNASPPATSAQVGIYRLVGGNAQLIWSSTLGGGTFVSPGLDAGTYYASASLNLPPSPQCQVYPGQACPASGPPIVVGQATPIVLPAATGIYPGVDFTFNTDAVFGNSFEP